MYNNDSYKTQAQVYLNDEDLMFADGAMYGISDLSLSNPLTLSYVATSTGVPSDLEWLLQLSVCVFKFASHQGYRERAC
jgi:hypothetical protein